MACSYQAAQIHLSCQNYTSWPWMAMMSWKLQNDANGQLWEEVSQQRLQRSILLSCFGPYPTTLTRAILKRKGGNMGTFMFCSLQTYFSTRVAMARKVGHLFSKWRTSSRREKIKIHTICHLSYKSTVKRNTQRLTATSSSRSRIKDLSW